MKNGKAANYHHTNEQAGFRYECGTMQHLQTIQILVEKTKLMLPMQGTTLGSQN